MKVRLEKPAQRVVITVPRVIDRGRTMSFVNGDTCTIVGIPSSAYQLSFNRWQRQERGN